MLVDSSGQIEMQIATWIRHKVCQIDDTNGRCTKIVLRQLNIDKKPLSDVHSCSLSGDPAEEGTEVADRIVLEIADRAQNDANDLNQGVQTYALYAYFSAKGSITPRKIFRVAAEEEMERDSGPSEPPSEKGLLSQLMRHNEVTSKNSMVAMGYILATFQKEIKEQREQNRAFMSQQIDMTMLIQEVLNESSKRRIEEKQAEMQTSLIEGTFEHLKIALPILINRLAGKEVFAPKMERELYLMATLLETLDPEQQNALQGMLKPGQLAALAEILSHYEGRKQKHVDKEAAENKAKPGSSGGNTLLKLFEKRGDLVNEDSAVEPNDRRVKRIEKKAADIRGRLGDVKRIIDPSSKD